MNRGFVWQYQERAEPVRHDLGSPPPETITLDKWFREIVQPPRLLKRRDWRWCYPHAGAFDPLPLPPAQPEVLLDRYYMPIVQPPAHLRRRLPVAAMPVLSWHSDTPPSPGGGAAGHKALLLLGVG